MAADIRPSAAALERAVAAFFGSDSPLRRGGSFGDRDYEDRPQQRQMAEAIAASLAAGKHLAVEAPTGIGKSFAYLVPAIHFSLLTKKPVVVTTHTIALQEQLLNKDLPLLHERLGVPFKSALAKGRGNYLCYRRLENVAVSQDEYLPSTDLVPEVEKIAKWARTTKDGTLADLPFSPNGRAWTSVCAEAGTCPREDCDEERCFFRRARRKLWNTNIIVANHALFCIDLALRRDSKGEQGLLPEYSAVIVDEAHTLEGVAAEHLGIHLTSIEALFLLNRLFSRGGKRGLLARQGCLEAREACAAANRAADRYFTHLVEWLEAQDDNPLVYTTPGHVPNRLTDPFSRLAAELAKLIKDTDALDKELREEIKLIHARLVDYLTQLDTFLEMGVPDHVYWFERYGRDGSLVSLNGVPIDVAEALRPVLFQRDFSVVLTSATLAVDGALSYFQQRLGAEDAEALVLDSPYDFRRQVQLHLPGNDAPSPKEGDDFARYCAANIRFFVEQTHGKAFVLFTSYRMMDEVADDLESFFADKGIRLMVQGRDLQRSQMLDAFRADTDSVIFGTDSFWMGVDVPGEALSNVIIVKLPFPVPSHPLIKARCERIEMEGRSSFREYSMPEAILKFRQGFGRLIRHRDDTGIIVVLDKRIRFSSYGSRFLAAIPPCDERDF